MMRQFRHTAPAFARVAPISIATLLRKVCLHTCAQAARMHWQASTIARSIQSEQGRHHMRARVCTAVLRGAQVHVHARIDAHP